MKESSKLNGNHFTIQKLFCIDVSNTVIRYATASLDSIGQLH